MTTKHTPELLDLVIAVRNGKRLSDAADTLLQYQDACSGNDALLVIRDRSIERLCNERDHLKSSNAELVAALEYALGALDADVSTAPMGEKQARLAQSWLRGKFGEQARAALAKAKGEV